MNNSVAYKTQNCETWVPHTLGQSSWDMDRVYRRENESLYCPAALDLFP